MEKVLFLMFLFIGIVVLIYAEGANKYIGGFFLLFCLWRVILGVLSMTKEADEEWQNIHNQ